MDVPNSSASGAPAVKAPALACDCHIHIYEPGLPAQGAVPTNAGVAAYRQVQALTGTARAVVVQPRPYGTDNTATLRAIRALGADRARGIAVVAPDIAESALQALHDGGIRGVRFSFHVPNAGAGDFGAVESLAGKIAPFGWHLQLHWTADQIAEQRALLQRLPVQVVFDHLGRFPVENATSHPAFPIVGDLLESGRAWIKLSGAYLDSKAGADGRYADTDIIARAWLALAPDRAVWGSDWPHVTEPVHKPDDALLFDLLARWCGDETTRGRVLVDNPARLYGFDSC